MARTRRVRRHGSCPWSGDAGGLTSRGTPVGLDGPMPVHIAKGVPYLGVAVLGVAVLGVAGEAVEEPARPTGRVAVSVEAPCGEVVGVGVHAAHSHRRGF